MLAMTAFCLSAHATTPTVVWRTLMRIVMAAGAVPPNEQIEQLGRTLRRAGHTIGLSSVELALRHILGYAVPRPDDYLAVSLYILLQADALHQLHGEAHLATYREAAHQQLHTLAQHDTTGRFLTYLGFDDS